jgi:predicted kinase
LSKTLHLLHGFVGAGKTTFAKKLEKEIHAVRFSPDDWMCRLYGDNPPQEFFAEYDRRIKSMIWDMAEKLLSSNVDVILDYGFWKFSEREDYRTRGLRAGAEVKLYALQCPEDVMRDRVLERTAEMPEGALMIDDNAITEFRARFEAVDPEKEACIVVKSS